MFTPTAMTTTTDPGEQATATLGTPRLPTLLGFAAMNTNAAFAAALNARVDSATRPADDTAQGRAYFERGRGNQFMLWAVAVGTGTLSERVYKWLPNFDGTVWRLTLVLEITWTFTSAGRVVPAALVNGAAGTIRYATSCTVTDYTPVNKGAPLKSAEANDQPAWVVADPMGGWMIEREGAIAGGGITSFNFLSEVI